MIAHALEARTVVQSRGRSYFGFTIVLRSRGGGGGEPLRTAIRHTTILVLGRHGAQSKP
jgi:hypothetical protein